MIMPIYTKFLVLIFILQVTFSYAVPLQNAPLIQSTANPATGVNSFLRGLIENYRKVMRTGMPEKNIPVLDPLKIRKLVTFNVKDKQAFMQVNLTDLDIKGLSGFVVERLNANLNESKIYLEVRFPETTTNGKYKMEGRVIEIVPIRGNGTFWASSKDVKVTATASVHTEHKTALKNNSYLQLNDDLNLIVDYDKLQMDVEGLEGSTSWTAVVKKLLNVTSKEFVKRFLPTLQEKLNKAVVVSLNKGLKKIPFYIWTSGTEYVDNVLLQISDLIKKSKSPMPLPNFHANFSKEILFATVTGYAKLDLRSVHGMENIKRIDELESISNKTHMLIKGKLSIKDIKLVYGGFMAFMTISESVFCKAYIPEITFSFAVIHSNERDAKPHLGDLKIIGKHNVNIEISDLGHLEWMSTWLNNGFTEHVDKTFQKSIPAQLANYFQKTI